MKKDIIRDELLEDDVFRKLHNKWSMENDSLLERKNEWNFGIIIRNHTRECFSEMIERALEIYKIK